MRASVLLLTVAMFLLEMVFCDPAHAVRRSIRFAAGGWDGQFSFGVNCPGTTPLGGSPAASLPLDWGEIRFHGRGDTDYTDNMGCDKTIPDQFNESYFEFLDPPENSLRTFVGTNIDNAASALRYTWTSNDPTKGSYQWILYSFPKGITIAGLYGLYDVSQFPEVPLVLDVSTAIEQGGVTVWSAAGNQFDGEYFCFVDGEFAGLWNGELDDHGSACLEAGDIFNGGFE